MSNMKFYVAGKFEDKSDVREVMDIIKKAGHFVTHDWTLREKEGADLVKCAREDYNGIVNCQILVAVLLKENNYRGLWVEIGIALAMKKIIAVIGEGENDCIFLTLPEVIHHKDIADFEKALTTKMEKG